MELKYASKLCTKPLHNPFLNTLLSIPECARNTNKQLALFNKELALFNK